MLLSFIAGCVLACALILGNIGSDISRIKNIIVDYEHRRINKAYRKYIETGKID